MKNNVLSLWKLVQTDVLNISDNSCLWIGARPVSCSGSDNVEYVALIKYSLQYFIIYSLCAQQLICLFYNHPPTEYLQFLKN